MIAEEEAAKSRKQMHAKHEESRNGDKSMLNSTHDMTLKDRMAIHEDLEAEQLFELADDDEVMTAQAQNKQKDVEMLFGDGQDEWND